MDKLLTTFYIVRHSEAEHNITKQFGLNPEAKLTAKGELQAQALSKVFQDIHFDVVFSSDFIRTKRTAELIVKEKQLAVNTSKALRERSYGRLNGKTEGEIKSELKDIYDEYMKLSDKEKFTKTLVEDMESTEAALSRVITFLRELAIGYRGKTILVVTHSTILRGLLIHLGFADFHEIDRDGISNTAYLRVESDGSDFFLKETFGIRKKF